MPAAQHADAMIVRLESEIEERNALIQGLAQDAQVSNNGEGRDLTTSELEQINRAKDRIAELKDQLGPLRDSARVALEARTRREELSAEINRLRSRGGAVAGTVEYRSAGEYIADLYTARMGEREAADRLEVFHRAAAHQTTADNAGLLPERIIEPVINGIDMARPVVSAIGPTDLGPGSWAYAKVTQHTQVGVQSAEKTELASRKMLVTKTSITAPTYGGYVNVSKQDIRRTSPQILDMVIADLAGQYAIETEDDCIDALVAAATAGTATYPAANPTALNIANAVYGAVGQSAANLRTAGIPATGPILVVAPDRMGVLGPLFPSVNPTNSFSTGFSADTLANQGVQANLAGLQVIMSAAVASGTVLFFYRSAVRVFEDRYGAMQVNEPSVWGVQVGYAGDFQTLVVQANGLISIASA